MNSPHRVVIAGASIAGVTAAETLRYRGFGGDVLLLGDEPHLPYARPPLSKQILLEGWEPDRTTIKTLQELDDLGIQFRSSAAALALNPTERTVVTTEGAERYDDLIIATGARARRFGGNTGIRTLRTIDDALCLRNDMGNAKHLVVIGAGVLGSEIASAGRALGADVTLIGNKGQISFGSIGKALSSQIQDLHRGHGVALQLNVNITDVNEEDGFIHLGLGNGQTASGDIVVATIGTIARVEWLEGSGLEIADAVVCDEKGQASPGVYAVGDVAAWRDPTTGKATRVEHQTNAIDQAMSVAATIVDGQESIAPVPFFWSDIHGVSIKAYGWFYGHSLEKIDSTSEKGTLFASKEDGLTSGVISWDLAASAFRKSCAFVDESFTQRYRKLIVEEQR